MPANFSNLRLRFQHRCLDEKLNFDTDFNLTSINFDLNQTAIVAGTEFTSDLSFILKIESNDDYSNFNELVGLIRNHFIGEIPSEPELTPEELVTWMLKATVFELTGSGINGSCPFLFQFDNRSTSKAVSPLSEGEMIMSSVTPIATNQSDLPSLSWFIQLKFRNPSSGSTAGTYYPCFNFSLPSGSNAATPGFLSLDETLLRLFNNELGLNYELLISEELRSGGGGDVIGKAAEDLIDSINHLSSSLGNTLGGTLKAQLQPVSGACTPDLALWVMIKKGTEDLSFNRFQDFMDAIFCGGGSGTNSVQKNMATNLNSRRSLPFMNVDAYRSVKIAAEAFVMANCAVNRQFTKEDMEDFEFRGPVQNCITDETKLQAFWDAYRERVTGVSDPIIPYLAVIKGKFREVDIKTASFADAFDSYLASESDRTVNTCYGLIQERLTYPCFLELIWSYWHEESMMVQGLNTIFRRFQNVKNPSGKDPLSNLAIDPIRPLSNLIWGFVQDEQNWLTVKRRAYEYGNQYGISLHGNAASGLNFADFRTNFLEAFHRLLHTTTKFYKQADDMTVNPDAFPVLNALKEVHLILSEGAHNQYGELPSVARAEMLMQQWLLARPEFREFLPTRIMVAYPEAWMDRVAALNNLMGWTTASPIHFGALGRFGEQILLSIRFGNWSNINIRDAAANWAHFWREQIQGYIHAYNAVTGVDLTTTLVGNKIDSRPPSYHLAKRLQSRQNGQAPAPSQNGVPTKKGAIKKEW